MKTIYTYTLLVLTLLFIDNGVYAAYCNTPASTVAITPTGAAQNTATYSSGRRAFTFNATAGCTYSFSTCGNTTQDTYLRLYSGNGGTLLVSADDQCGAQSSISWVCTTTGAYSVLLTRYSCSTLNTNTFMTYSVSCPAVCTQNSVTLTMNDSYGDGWNGGAITLTNDSGGSYGPYSITGASGSQALCLPDGCYSINQVAGSWHGEITWSLSNGVSGNGYYGSQSNVFTLGSGSCGAVTGCTDPAAANYNPLATLSDGSCVYPPSNDNPCSAIALPVNSSCSYLTYTNANATATSGPPAPGCAFYVGSDVWFTVTVPSSGMVNLDMQTGVMTDAGMAVYSGTCGSLTLIECDDDDSPNGLMSAINLTGQTPGSTLWIRVWEYGGDNNGTFGICASSPLTYQDTWVSMNTGSSNWCVGETRTVSVTVTNSGSATLTNATPDVNIGVKWNADADYFVRVDANGLAPGATLTYNLSVTAPSTAGTDNLTFDIVNEANFWFANNTNGGGPGNVVYTSPLITINDYPTVNAGAPFAAICQGGTSTAMGGSVGGGATGGTWSGGAGSWTNANDPANATYMAGAGESGSITLTLTTSGGSCGTTFVTKTITVDAASVAASSINNLNPVICHGAAMQLDVVGGSLAPGAQWEWFEGSCGSSVIGTGSPISVSPTGATDYFVRATSANSCAPTACTSISVTMPTTSTNLAVDGDIATCAVNSGNWIHFYNVDGRLIASVNSAGQDLGNVTATSLIAPSPYVMPSCTQSSDPSWFNAALARSFIITPTTQPTNAVSVRLYILDSEFNDYQTSALGTTQNANDDVSTITDMDMTKHSSPFEDGNPLNNCGVGSTIYVPQSGSGLTSAVMGGFSGSYYIEYSISSFSEMFPMNSSNSALPVTMTSFNANCAGDKVNITWTTASEFNASHYSLQTSRDGQTWTEVAEIAAAGTTSQESNYAYQDFLFGGVSYYRLVQVDLDGASEIYGPISVDCEISESSMTVYPNPTDNDFTVLIQTTESFENATIELVDLSGRAVEVKEMNILPGSTQVRFETKGIMPGTYIVRIKCENDKFTPIRVVVM